MNLKLFSLIGFLAAVVALFILVYRQAFVAQGVPAIAVQVLSLLLMVWARITFGSRSFHAVANPTEGGLVTTGPYAHWRHPIYAAVIYAVFAGALSHFSPVNLGLAFVATAGLGVRMYAEEQLVVVRYPEYAAYAARVKRIVPFIF